MSIPSTAAAAWAFFTGKGYSPSATAGILGNLDEESGINPTRNQAGGGAGRGIAQWTYSQRWQNLLHYASSSGRDPNALDTQLNFAYTEMQGMGLTPAKMNGLSVTGATTLFEQKFEAAGVPHMETRINDANELYSAYASGGAGAYMGNVTPTSASSSATNGGASAFPTGNDPILIIDKSLSLQNLADPSAWIHPIQSVTQDAGAIALRTVLVLIGLILVIFALVSVVEKAGVSVVA